MKKIRSHANIDLNFIKRAQFTLEEFSSYTTLFHPLIDFEEWFLLEYYVLPHFFLLCHIQQNISLISVDTKFYIARFAHSLFSCLPRLLPGLTDLENEAVIRSSVLTRGVLNRCGDLSCRAYNAQSKCSKCSLVRYCAKDCQQ